MHIRLVSWRGGGESRACTHSELEMMAAELARLGGAAVGLVTIGRRRCFSLDMVVHWATVNHQPNKEVSVMELNLIWQEVVNEMAAVGVHGPDQELDPTTIMVLAGLMGYEEEMVVEGGAKNFAEVFLYKLMRR